LSDDAKRFDDLKQTVAQLLEMAKMHAEGMKHMTDCMIAFDQRLRALEKTPKSSIVKPNGFHDNPLGKV